MKKRKSDHKKAVSRKKTRSSQNLFSNRTFIYTSGGIFGIALLFILLNTAAQTPVLQSNSKYDSQQYVLGEEDKDEEEAKKEEEKAAEDQKKTEEKAEEQAKQEEERSESQGNSGTSDSIRINSQSEGNKSETEIETADGQKIKTKIEDDGTTKIEIEHKNLKIKYEVLNGQVVVKAEDEDGGEVEIEDDELEELKNEIEEELEDNGIKIATGGAGRLIFAKNQIAATTSFPLSIDIGTNQLIVTTPAGEKIVAVLPDQAVENLLATGVISELARSTTEETALSNEIGMTNAIVEFKIKNDEPIYEIDGIKIYRLFAVIPVSRPVTAVVSSETGELIEREQSFLTNIVDLLSP